MVRAVIVFVVAVVGCKSSEKPAGGGGRGSTGAPSSAGATAGACKPMPGMCSKLAAADLGKLFEAPALASSGEENHDDSPLGPMAVCNYKEEDDKVSINVTLRYRCASDGPDGAARVYKGEHDAVATVGQALEPVGVGDEGYWTYSADNTGFVQGHVKARKGALIVEMLYGLYRVGGKPIDPAVAKQRAIDAAQRVLAAAP